MEIITKLQDYNINKEVYEQASIYKKKMNRSLFALAVLIFLGLIILSSSADLSLIYSYLLFVFALSAPFLFSLFVAFRELRVIKKQVSSFESNLIKEVRGKLAKFYEDNLYRKRSDAIDFWENLQQFQDDVVFVKKLNDWLLTENVSTQFCEDYIRRRSHRAPITIDRKSEKQQDIFNPISSPENTKNLFVPPEKSFKVPKKIDWKKVLEKNMETGEEGERCVLEIERTYLKNIGRDDLVNEVKWVSKDVGDGFGYDILSFFGDGKKKYIEVKTTRNNMSSPFFLSENERVFLNDHKDDHFIYRVLISEDLGEIVVISAQDFLSGYDISPISYMVKPKSL